MRLRKMIEVIIEKITDSSLMQKACASTFHGDKPTKITLDKIYKCEHSPIRTQLYWVEIKEIPTFVSTHFVRHKIGVEHFVSTNRIDRGGDVVADRNTPIRVHSMLINAQSLINMAKDRLCTGASKETREVMEMIKVCIKNIDPDLYKYLVPKCFYRNGLCPELRSCGLNKTYNPQEYKNE